MHWTSFGAGVLVGWTGKKLLNALLNAVGTAVRGVYKVILDATRLEFNKQAAREDFDFKQTIETDVIDYKNPLTLFTWLKRYAAQHAYSGLLLQGLVFAFDYKDPLHKDKLEFYDTSPVVLSFGIYAAHTGNIVEYAVNLHYLPLHIREALLIDVFNDYRKAYKNVMFSYEPRAVNEFSWEYLQKYVRKYGIDFAVRSYIPERRKHTILIDYQDWGKAIRIPSRAFVGITDAELTRRYKLHLLELKHKTS